MTTTLPEIQHAQPLAWESEKFEIPPLPQRPEKGSREATEDMIQGIDGKIAQLAKLGLRPHPIMLGYRQELVEQLDQGGPYCLRVTSRVL